MVPQSSRHQYVELHGVSTTSVPLKQIALSVWPHTEEVKTVSSLYRAQSCFVNMPSSVCDDASSDDVDEAYDMSTTPKKVRVVRHDARRRDRLRSLGCSQVSAIAEIANDPNNRNPPIFSYI